MYYRQTPHKSCLLLHGILDDGPDFGYVAEYCPNGSLYLIIILCVKCFLILNRAMKLKNKDLSAVQAVEHAFSLAKSLDVLHAKRLAHRNINNANIMVKKTEKKE